VALEFMPPCSFGRRTEEKTVQIRGADIEDVREIRRVARTTWDHTYRDSLSEEVRTEFVRRAYSDDSLL